MRRVYSWIQVYGLSPAMEKKEIVLLTRKQIPTIFEVRVVTGTIRTKDAVKYLEVRLDTKLTFWQQINFASERVLKISSALSRLMTNVVGSTANRRKLLMTVTHSFLLYGYVEKYCQLYSEEKPSGWRVPTEQFRS